MTGKIWVRLRGHAHAQPNVLPNPDGSELSRLAIWLPFSVQLPAKIQQPLAVKWTGIDVPDYSNAAPGSDVGPFIMQPEGMGRLFAIGIHFAPINIKGFNTFSDHRFRFDITTF